ncbi:MAG: polyprenyl synthetase family protein [Atopobiaceae bacterium]|nr:polyprenyl synthetase family protein [Atopobiaceae bacterium]MBR1829124.1 polyprenyl synthetase family protein [Atopobiaceae bacterium]
MIQYGGELFVSYLKRRRPQVEDFLARFTPRPEDSTVHAAGDLSRYLYEPLARFTAGGGKRTRPVLCLLGAQAVGVDPICALSTAAAIEYFQSAALIHDDIADKSELRRGEPCLHISDGTGIAINAGDLALVNVYAGLLVDGSLDNETCLRILCELTYMEQRTLEGQALDLGWVRDERWDVTVDDYLFMATHKTAYYSAATPLACGVICAGGTDEQVDALFSFGLDAGLAFQLQDDLLNLVGDPAEQGKDYRSDITEGKRTMAAVWALGHLEGPERDELRSILSAHTSDPKDLARAVELMEQAGAIEHVRQKAQELVEQARGHLDGVEIDEEARKVLLSMATFFIERLG